MFLEKLEIFGFKAIPYKLRVQFGTGVTGIIGPNGCGKSNFPDAIRWVPGGQSVRPRRCPASARVTRSVISRAIPEPGSNRDRRASPASTTTRICSIVSEVSAIEVDRTTLRFPFSGAIAARWAA